MEENKQKTQYDRTVRNLVRQTKNIMGNIIGVQGKKKNIEYIREETYSRIKRKIRKNK